MRRDEGAQRHGDDGRGACDDPRPHADEGRSDAHDDAAPDADKRADADDRRARNGLGQQRERDAQPGERLVDDDHLTSAGARERLGAPRLVIARRGETGTPALQAAALQPRAAADLQEARRAPGLDVQQQRGAEQHCRRSHRLKMPRPDVHMPAANFDASLSRKLLRHRRPRARRSDCRSLVHGLDGGGAPLLRWLNGFTFPGDPGSPSGRL